MGSKVYAEYLTANTARKQKNKEEEKMNRETDKYIQKQYSTFNIFTTRINTYEWSYKQTIFLANITFLTS